MSVAIIHRWPDPVRVADIIREAAQEEMLPRFRALDEGEEVWRKESGGVVTVVDEAMERRLGSLLGALLPGAALVGEEGVAADPSRRAALVADEPVWVIDPLDGTVNFVKGVPRFACIVSLVYQDQPVAGWIYDPIGDHLAVAETGQGVRIDDVAPPRPLDRPLSALRGCFGVPPGKGALLEGLARLDGRVAERRRTTCAGHTFLDLLEQRIDLALFRRMTPWDHAAGVLAFREAGGLAELPDHTPYRVSLGIGPLILAPGPDSFAETVSVLRGEPG